MNNQKALCVKLPEDLYTAAHDRADAEGISVSELMRALLNQFVYGTIPSVDEGYIQARRHAIFIAHKMLKHALDILPQTIEEAIELERRLREARQVNP